MNSERLTETLERTPGPTSAALIRKGDWIRFRGVEGIVDRTYSTGPTTVDGLAVVWSGPGRDDSLVVRWTEIVDLLEVGPF